MDKTDKPTTINNFTNQTHSSKRTRIVQNFVLIWLDSSIDELNNDCPSSISQLQRIVNYINLFTDPDECIKYLANIKDEKAFMIVPGYLGQHIVPRIHEISQLDSIYVFCSRKSRHEQWAKEWSKVKGVFTKIDLICESLKQTARQCDKDSIMISLISTSDVTSINLDQLDQSFMYTQIFKEILFEIEFDEQVIKELAIYCRNQFANNRVELNNIDMFEHQYRRQTPIWWYTYECFLYPMLNRALRTQEMDTLIKLGFFIRDLHCHIEQLHREQLEKYQEQTFTVYRGQGMSIGDFEKLMQTKGGLLSFNNFLSTSEKRDVSLNFAYGALTKPQSIGILFIMTIDPSISSSPFALLDNVSYFKDTESEILFSMHTVFRISDIKQIDNNNRLWQVELNLTSDNDPLQSELTKQMREETFEGAKGWYRLGMLLIKLGDFDKAENVYNILLDLASDDIEYGNIYRQLGYIKELNGNYVEATSLYEKSLEIYQKILPPDDPSLADSYDNIGVVYMQMGEFSKALTSYEKSLEIYHKTLPPNHPSLANLYNNIGKVYSDMGEYSKALSCFDEVLKILQKTLSSNHPKFALTYNNIGLTYISMGDCSKALLFYEKALEIGQKTLPSNHPDLANFYNNIGAVYDNMKEYSKGLSFYEKALEIRQKTLSPHHPSLAGSYNNIGLVYTNMEQYSKALSYYEKALEIYEKVLPPTHPNLATAYNNIALTYFNMEQYSKALSSYERAMKIAQSSLPTNHPHLQSLRKSIEVVIKQIEISGHKSEQ